MKQNKLGIIFIVAIMALAAVGAGYAMWSQTLTINGTIGTGTFCVGVRDDGTGDPGAYFTPGGTGWLYPDGVNPGTTRTLDVMGGTKGTWDLNYLVDELADNSEGKNIGQTESTDVAYKYVHEGLDYGDEITETVYNAYPYYQSWITITFANCGTVPAKINSGTWVPVSGTNLLPWLVVDEVYIVEDFHEYDTEVAKWYGEFTEAQMDGFQYQLDPCDTVTFVILFHFKETATINVPDPGDDDISTEVIMPEGASMEFDYVIEWAQWNEVDAAATALGAPTTPPLWYPI